MLGPPTSLLSAQNSGTTCEMQLTTRDHTNVWPTSSKFCASLWIWCKTRMVKSRQMLSGGQGPLSQIPVKVCKQLMSPFICRLLRQPLFVEGVCCLCILHCCIVFEIYMFSQHCHIEVIQLLGRQYLGYSRNHVTHSAHHVYVTHLCICTHKYV